MPFFMEHRKKYIKRYYFNRPNDLKYKELMTVTKDTQLTKLSRFVVLLLKHFNNIKISSSSEKAHRNLFSVALFLCVAGARCAVCVEFYGPVNNEVMSGRSFNSGTVPGQT